MKLKIFQLQANKMIFRILLLVVSFVKKEVLKVYRIFPFVQVFTQCFQCFLYCEFRLVRLCPIFADVVTYNLV